MLDAIRNALRGVADPEKAKLAKRFFKMGPGEYGEGDEFLGITVPAIRMVAKEFFKTLSLEDIRSLLHSPWHEERLASLIILIMKYRHGDESTRKEIYDLYMENTLWINNWDLVDSSAEFIVGPWLDGKPEQITVLTQLAHSSSIWERRIAILSTFYYIKDGRPDATLFVARLLLEDTHPLIQKAVGWMLREVGKRINKQLLIQFLDNHVAIMPSLTVRYATEHFEPLERRAYLQAQGKSRQTPAQGLTHKK